MAILPFLGIIYIFVINVHICGYYEFKSEWLIGLSLLLFLLGMFRRIFRVFIKHYYRIILFHTILYYFNRYSCVILHRITRNIFTIYCICLFTVFCVIPFLDMSYSCSFKKFSCSVKKFSCMFLVC